MTSQQMYEYYESEGFQPTYANTDNNFDFCGYRAMRQDFFSNKLKLPEKIFQNSSLLEFGPDTGENALVFAAEGSNVTLVEPNKKALPYIRNYFDQYLLSGKLKDIIVTDVESFTSEDQFDLVVAEGFIYTVKPNRMWLQKTSRLLRPGGFFVVSYYEVFGSFFEILQRVIFRYITKATNTDPIGAAKSVFQTKWNTLGHTRAFESWVRDVLLNPFVRLKYFISAEELVTEALDEGMSLYSAWPSYENTLDVCWHKKKRSREDVLTSNKDFIRRSTFSYLVGKNAFLAGSEELVDDIKDSFEGMYARIDKLIDFSGDVEIVEAIASVQVARQAFNRAVEGGGGSGQSIKKLIDCVDIVLGNIQGGDLAGLVKFCNTDPFFLEMWGLPHHYAVFRKL